MRREVTGRVGSQSSRGILSQKEYYVNILLFMNYTAIVSSAYGEA